MTDTDRAAWLESRRAGIGGSDIAAIVGIDKYRSAWDVYHSKLDPPDDKPPSEAALWGTLQEGIIAEEWARRNHVTLVPGTLTQHPKHSWMIGTPDRLTTESPQRLLEVKTAGSWPWQHDWDSGAIVPGYYQCQVQWYLAITGLNDAVLAVLVAGNHLETFDIKRDDAAIEQLIEAGSEFWTQHVSARLPPDPAGTDRATRAIEARYVAPAVSRSAILPADAAEHIKSYLSARELAGLYGRQQRAEANWLREALGEADADEGLLPGDSTPSVTWKRQRALDVRSLVTELTARMTPTQIAQYVTAVDLQALTADIGAEAINTHRHTGDVRRLVVKGGGDPF